MFNEITESLPEFSQAVGAQGLKKLANAASLMRITKGRKLIRDNQPVDSLYLVLQGNLLVQVEQDNMYRTVGKVSPGEWVGEVSVLSGSMVASASLVAEADVKLLRLSHQAFDALIAASDELTNFLLRDMVTNLAARLRNAYSRYKEQPSLPVNFQPTDVESPGTSKELGWLGRLFGARSSIKGSTDGS